MNALLERQGAVQEKLDAAGAWDLDSRLEMAMDALRCPPGETRVKILSGGEKRRVALCRLLLKQPDILLLDEPTNHLDAESVAWLEQHLQKYPGTVIAVTHDRYFLDNVAGWILELDQGRGIPWEGNYSSWLEQKQAAPCDRKRKPKASGKRRFSASWNGFACRLKARHAKAKARINSYEAMLTQETEKRSQELEIYIPPGPRLGDVVIEANARQQGVRRQPADRGHDVLASAGRDRRGDRPERRGQDHAVSDDHRRRSNPTAGRFDVGETVKLGYVDQSRDTLDPLTSRSGKRSPAAQDTIELGKRQVNSRAYVARFNFSGTDQQKKVGMLSGGERNRVHLAKMLKEGANVLLLDEPTNDLDVNTMRALEEALENFAGCAVIISHDRWFLDRIATHILAFEGDSHVVFFDGNYSEYEADRKMRLGAAADQPHRIKYRQLTRN